MKPLLMDHGLMVRPTVSDQPVRTGPENVPHYKACAGWRRCEVPRCAGQERLFARGRELAVPAGGQW